MLIISVWSATMGYELEMILRKLEEAFVCVLNGNKEIFNQQKHLKIASLKKDVNLLQLVLRMGRFCLS
jgi:hypothetical protein